MAEVKTDGTPEVYKIEVSDILGLWEVIRIDIQGEVSIYPWIRGRFMFNFLEGNIFTCVKEGKFSDGTWEFSIKTWESEKQFTIILNEVFEYIIIRTEDDEMILADRGSKYLLTRKL